MSCECRYRVLILLLAPVTCRPSRAYDRAFPFCFARLVHRHKLPSVTIMASLLDRSLDDLARQDKESSRKSSNRGRGGSSRGAGRAAPYAVRAHVQYIQTARRLTSDLILSCSIHYALLCLRYTLFLHTCLPTLVLGFQQKQRPSRVDHDADTWQHDLFNTNKLDYGDDPSSSGGGGESARAGRSDEDGPRSTRLKITNLHYEVSEEELRVCLASSQW